MQRHIKLKKLKRKRKHGFFARMESHHGKKILKRRREKERLRLTI